MKNSSQLLEELARIDHSDAPQLALLARAISRSSAALAPTPLSGRKRRAILRASMQTQSKQAPRRKLFYLGAPALALGGFILLSFVALSSLPGDKLYALKKANEAIRLTLQPDYITVVAEKRSNEAEALVKKGANDTVIQQAVDKYTKTVEEAKKEGYNVSKRTIRGYNETDNSELTGPSTSGEGDKHSVQGVQTTKPSSSVKPTAKTSTPTNSESESSTH